MEIIDMDQPFDECVDIDLFHHSGSMADQSGFYNPIGLLKTPFANDGNIFKSESRLDRDAECAWHKALPECEQVPDLALPDDYSPISPELKGTQWLGADLPSLEDTSERDRIQLRSISQPSTPQTRSKRSIKKTLSFDNHPIIQGNQDTLRSPPFDSTARMRQPLYGASRRPNIRPSNVNNSAKTNHVQVASTGINSPPLSSTMDQNGNRRPFFSQIPQPYPAFYPAFHGDDILDTSASFPNYQSPPQVSPAMENLTSSASFATDRVEMAYNTTEPGAALSALHTPPSSIGASATRWGFNTSPKQNFAFSASSELHDAVTMAGSWNGYFNQPHSYCASYPPSTSRSTRHADALMDGLGISYGIMQFDDFDCVGRGAGAGENARSASALSLRLDGYSASQQLLEQQKQKKDEVSDERGSMSPSPSPLPQPPSRRRRPSSHASASRRHRRKSSDSSLFQWRQSESDSMGFVNFTPDDRNKLLKGVAPSGSSKTKARRDKEAHDKRRKLSQAAVKAVMEAGGDIDSLKKLDSEGLFVLGT